MQKVKIFKSTTDTKTFGKVIHSTKGINFYLVDPVTSKIIEDDHPLKNTEIKSSVLVFPSGKGSSVVQIDGLYQLRTRNTQPAAVIVKTPDPVLISACFICSVPLVCVTEDADFNVVSNSKYLEIDGKNGYVYAYDEKPENDIILVIDDEFLEHAVEREIIERDLPGTIVVELQSTDEIESYGISDNVIGIIAQIYVKLDESVIGNMPKLRGISISGGGYNNVHMESVSKHGVHVSRVSNYCDEDVVEHITGFIFYFARRFQKLNLTESLKWGASAVGDTRKIDSWNRTTQLSLPIRIQGSTAFIVGFGNIGHLLAKKLKTLGVNVLYYDVLPGESTDAKRVTEINEGLEAADFVILTVPLNESTRNLIGSAELDHMKKTAILINTSRGEIVNEKDLFEALRNGKIMGAGLDVLSVEPPETIPEISKLPNVLTTPHIAYISETSLKELKNRSALNLVHMLKGEKLPDKDQVV